MNKEKIKKMVPACVLSKYIYGKYFFKRNFEKGAFLLFTIPKSGTNYFRIMFTNYLYSLYLPEEGRITYTRMKEEVFPNVWHEVISGRKEYAGPGKGHIIRNTEYSDFIYDHGYYYLEFSKAKRMLFIARNPLDYIVSCFYYSFKNRPGREDMYKSPSEIIDFILKDSYVDDYLKMRKLSKERTDVKLISYENLIRFPFPTFYDVLSWLNIDINITCINRAIEFSDKKYVKKEEADLKKAIHSPAGQKGSFVRSGEVGDWKNYFTEKDIKKIKEILEKKEISLDEFIIE